MTTVRDYFDSIFLGSLPDEDLAEILDNQKCDATDGDILKEIPLDSVCGNACRETLDAALAFWNKVHLCFAGDRPEHEKNIVAAAVDVCCCYIRG